MDKSILEQYESACRLVDETMNDLEKLRRAKHEVRQDSVKGSNPEFPYEPMSFHIEGLSYTVYADPDAVKRMEQLLQERLQKAHELQQEVEAWINAAPPRIQRIVRMRYIKRMTWEQVSANMGMTSADAARKILDRYLQNNC